MTDATPLVIALPKGRVLKSAVELFGRAGYDISASLGPSRKLTYDCGDLRVLILRAADVPTYVDHGAADAGIVGSDVLEEAGLELYEPVDLGIGACRMIIASPKDRTSGPGGQAHLRVATKYPRIARRYFQERGQTAEIIKLSGAIELAPLIGLCDQIMDLVETGETLRQNGLVEVAEVRRVSSRLIANPARLKLRHRELTALIEKLAAQV